MPAGLAPTLLDPRNDYVFKRIFADDLALLSDLINAVLGNASPIHVDQVLNPRIDAEQLSGKFIVLDLLVHDDTGARYNVEMQIRRHGHWPDRITYYLAKAYVGQLGRGEQFEKLRPAIGIYLMGFELFDDPDRAHWQFEIRERGRPELRMSDGLQWNLIELPKAERLLPPAGKSPTPLAAWITFFQHGQDEAIMKTIIHPPVQQAMDKLKRLTDSEEERHNALLRDLALHDEATFRQEALEEGERRGEQKTIRKLVRQLVAQLDLDDAAIARLTGLSETEVQRLRQDTSD